MNNTSLKGTPKQILSRFPSKAAAIRHYLATDKHTISQIAKALGVSYQYVYQINASPAPTRQRQSAKPQASGPAPATNVPSPSRVFGRPAVLIASLLLLISAFNFLSGNILIATQLGGAGLALIVLVDAMRKEFRE